MMWFQPPCDAVCTKWEIQTKSQNTTKKSFCYALSATQIIVNSIKYLIILDNEKEKGKKARYLHGIRCHQVNKPI